jgi:pyruvate dehydrogenase E2 component (dihydrolipoamide acetyltransferase)
MPTEVILPRVDMDMTEAMIAAWHVNEGDEVREGTLIFEIETSKATMEIDAPASGIIRQISAPVGKSIPVGTAVAWIYAAGEALREQDTPKTVDGPAAKAEALTPVDLQGEAGHQQLGQAEALASTDAAVSPDAAAPTQQPLRATPAARRLARERGLQLVQITGSGPHGRIAAQDVLRAATQNAPSRGVPNSAPGALLHSIALRKGSGDPLVLLHGFAAESNSWRPFAQGLGHLTGPELGILAVDLPAHGKSPAQAAGSLEAIVEALEHTLLAANVEGCHLLGHSFGGAIALATAATARHLQVRSLTLLAPAGLGPESNGPFIQGVTLASRRASLAAWLKQLFADPSRMDEGFVATAWQQLESPQVRERLAAVADSFFPDGTQTLDLRHLFHALSVPVRVVWGQQDRILPVRHADGLRGAVGVHRFAGVGHLPHVEALSEVAMIVAQNIGQWFHNEQGGVGRNGTSGVFPNVIRHEQLYY